jgi:hypothetical protein
MLPKVDVNAQDPTSSNQTPLMVAVAAGWEPMISLFLRANINDLTAFEPRYRDEAGFPAQLRAWGPLPQSSPFLFLSEMRAI